MGSVKCVMLFAVILWAAARASDGIEFCVAANGQDANPGTKEKPFGSLERARDVIRELKKGGQLRGPVTVCIRGGVYGRTETFQLAEEDSGTEQSPVVYRAYENEDVRLMGGQGLKPSWFEPVKDEGVLKRLEERVRDEVRQVDLKAHGMTDYGELGSLAGGMTLFCNGRRMPLARWPNEGWALACSANTVGLDEDTAAQLAKERKLGKVLAFEYEGDRPNHWSTLKGVWLRGYWQQEYQYDGWNPVRFDPDRREIELGWEAPPHLQTWRRFFAVNVLEEIDHLGEWYLDRNAGILYFFPPDNFGEGPIFVSILQDAMVAMDNCSYVTIRGLTFEVMRGLAVVVVGGTHNRIAGCTIRHAGQGVVLAGGTENGVIGCDIYDLDSMGIRISGGDRKTLTPAGLYAVNNHIHHYARLFRTWHPGIQVQGVGNRVAHNSIHHAPQFAISYEGNDHIFEFNNMHDLCLEQSDVGVIGCGTDWTYRGNVIRYNFIHHIPERPYPGVIGAYFDNCVSSAEVFGNVFFKVPKAVMIGGGRDFLIQNNIFVECGIPVDMDNRGLRWDHFRPGGPMYDKLKAVNHDKPPWSARYPRLASILDEIPQAPLGNVLARNVSVRSGWRDPEKVCRETFANNIDRTYMTIEDNFVTDEDPGFVDAASMDFQLRDDSIVYKKIAGFQRIPFEKIGLYQDEYRTTWPPLRPVP
jgi:hypothetical protein